tara:strand:+ start:37 stop:186 length:150 start_codon:yes stop_codon:yes gene_type:complete
MKNYTYFILGYIAAFLTILLASCTLSPIQANYDTPGHSSNYPLYVKVVD